MVKIILSKNDVEKVAELFEDSDFKRVNDTFVCDDPEEASAIAELILEDNDIPYKMENGSTKAVFMPEEGFFELEDYDYPRVSELFEEYIKV